MPKILVLAKSGFGKTTSYCGRERYGIKGLDPSNSYLIQCINRDIPNSKFKLTDKDLYTKGNRVQVGNFTGMERFMVVKELIDKIGVEQSPYANIIVDDFNYLSQDYYMENAQKGGWQTPKDIGYGMGLIFQAISNISSNKNIICLAHYEEYKDKNGDSISYKFKSTGNMVDGYITPEGKFDIILYGKSSWNDSSKSAIKQFVINYDGEYPAKDSLGILDDLPNEIPNDLGIIIEQINNWREKQRQNQE